MSAHLWEEEMTERHHISVVLTFASDDPPPADGPSLRDPDWVDDGFYRFIDCLTDELAGLELDGAIIDSDVIDDPEQMAVRVELSIEDDSADNAQSRAVEGIHRSLYTIDRHNRGWDVQIIDVTNPDRPDVFER